MSRRPKRARPDAREEAAADAALGKLHLHRFSSPTVLVLALIGVAAGFGQFGAVAALGEVAKAFGHQAHGATIADQAGLSGTELGIGLAILRIASLGGVVLTASADRLGRRRSLLWNSAVGLAVTAAAALSPSYWSFVAIFALGRPLLSTASALTQVMAAEETDSKNRARAIALVTGGYGLGSGISAVLHSLFGSAAAFRPLFALALVPLFAIAPLARHIAETGRFTLQVPDPRRQRPLLGAIGQIHRRRLAVVLGIAFTVAFMSGPVNSFFFIYGENVLKVSGGAIALTVIAAGVAGLGGLVLGQRVADRYGRRPSGAVALVAMACCGTLTYSGSRPALIVGYVAGICFAAVFAPSAGAISNEVFPTEVRASVAGWIVAASVIGGVAGLLCFGAIADAGRAFRLGAGLVSAVAILGAALFVLLPETAGYEPEEVAAAPARRNTLGLG